MSKNQFTGTATQPQRNRKFCQFNNDQYCITGLTSQFGVFCIPICFTRKAPISEHCTHISSITVLVLSKLKN